MKLSISQTSILLLARTENCRSQPVPRNLHAAVIRQRTKRIFQATKKGSEKLQSSETQTNTFSSADLLRLPSVLLSASQPEGEIPARFDSERVWKITDRIEVSGAIEKALRNPIPSLLGAASWAQPPPAQESPAFGKRSCHPRGPAGPGPGGGWHQPPPRRGPGGHPACSPKPRALLSPRYPHPQVNSQWLCCPESFGNLFFPGQVYLGPNVALPPLHFI